METSILKVSMNGLKISLMDGTEWAIINVGDITRTLRWYPTQKVKIEEDTLINLDTRGLDKVRAKRL